MTQEEILEGNKLIAEFMKPSWYDKRRKDYPFPFPVIEIVPAEDLIGYGKVPEGEIKHFSGKPNMMKYHSSWDWLMSCFNKLREFQCSYKISEEYCEIKSWIGQFNVECVYENTIEAAYNCMIRFIKWYNENKNK